MSKLLDLMTSSDMDNVLLSIEIIAGLDNDSVELMEFFADMVKVLDESEYLDEISWSLYDGDIFSVRIEYNAGKLEIVFDVNKTAVMKHDGLARYQLECCIARHYEFYRCNVRSDVVKEDITYCPYTLGINSVTDKLTIWSWRYCRSSMLDKYKDSFVEVMRNVFQYDNN